MTATGTNVERGPAPARRPPAARSILLDRALEALPLFRLSDSSEDQSISFVAPDGTRWRVIPLPGDRLPGTFDQDVYLEVLRRFNDAGMPDDGTISFTLHDFLRSMGRRVDGRTYEQLRAALARLHRTTLESTGAYWDARAGAPWSGQFSVLSSIRIDRRREAERDQLGLFVALPANEPGDARATISAPIRQNIAAGFTVPIVPARYLELSSPVSRRLYRLLGVAHAAGQDPWELPLASLAEQLPLSQRYPSHLQRVLQPAHEMLVAAGLVRSADIRQEPSGWTVAYAISPSDP